MQIRDRATNSTPRLVELPVPEVTADGLLIKVRTAGVNFADLMQQQGVYPRSIPAPYVPGHEVVGEVVAVGNQAPGFAVGERIAALLPAGGGFAQYAAVQASRAVAIPEQLADAEATALLTQGLTAWIMVHKFIKPGQSVLITAAAGGVGSLSVQLASLAGAAVTGAVGNVHKLPALEMLGVQGLSYQDPHWAEALQRRGTQFDVVLDAVGGATLQGAWSLLKNFGTLVIYGNASLADVSLPAASIGSLTFANQSLHFYGVTRCLEAEPGLHRKALLSLLQARLACKLRLPVHPAYALEDAAQALRDLAERRTQGKVVLTVLS